MKPSYRGRCFFPQKYLFDYLPFPLGTSDVYTASAMLIPPQGRGKQNSHFGTQNERKLRGFSLSTPHHF